jgi:hypothetical protein
MNDALKEFEKELIELHTKSYDNYDKKLSYLSASSIGVSMVFIKDIVGNINNCCFKWLLISSWILLTVTLVLNLFSHTFSAKRHNATLSEIRTNKYSPQSALKRNKQIILVNNIVNALFGLGISSLVLFIIINI